MTQQERLSYLVKGLVEEYTEKYKDEHIEIPNDEVEQFTLFRALCNIRAAGAMPIEWMKVQPRYYKHRGKLVSPEIVDGSKEFEAILDKCHIPYEIDNEVYCIYGYK